MFTGPTNQEPEALVRRSRRYLWGVLSVLIGTGLTLVATNRKGGYTYNLHQQASAQQAPARAWTREDSTLAEIIRRNPREFYTQRGQYLLTPLAATTLASKDVAGRYFFKDIKEEQLHVIISEEDILAEAARMGGDKIITSDKVTSAYQELTREFKDVGE